MGFYFIFTDALKGQFQPHTWFCQLFNRHIIGSRLVSDFAEVIKQASPTANCYLGFFKQIHHVLILSCLQSKIFSVWPICSFLNLFPPFLLLQTLGRKVCFFSISVYVCGPKRRKIPAFRVEAFFHPEQFFTTLSRQ